MDSKSGEPLTSYDTAAAPPPSYAESESADPSSSTSQYYSAQIQHQLRDITTTISSLQTQKSLLSHAQDEKVLSLLTLHIQTYLSDFAKTGLQKGTLILVPRKGLEDEHALPSRYDFKNPKEYDRVVRVGDKEDDINRSSDRDFGFDSASGDGQGKAELWYWRDEKMARRLAGYLRPKKDPAIAQQEELKAQQLQQQQQQRQQAEASSSSGSTSRSSFWGVRKLSAKLVDKAPMYLNSEEFAPFPIRDRDRDRDGGRERDVKAEPPKIEDRVVLDVKAEEVVFRTENDFGIYESRSGWSIVLELRVVL